MHSNTILAAAALVASVAAYDLPSCWTSCFEKYEVDSEGCLCTSKLGDVVSACVSSGCSASNATAYSSWLASYCNEAPVSSNTWAVPSSTYAIPSSVPAVYSSSPPVYTTPVESSPVESIPVYPTTEGWGPPAETTPVAYTTPVESVCTSSTTYIWRTTTSVGPPPVYPTTYPAGNATTATGAWPSSYVPATGGAGRVGAAAAVIGGALAAALL